MDAEITGEEDLKSIDLRTLATNKDLGRLNFASILGELEELRELFFELEELNFQERLTESESKSVEQHKERFIKLLNELRTFDIGQPDSQQRHDQLEEQVRNHYSSTLQSLRGVLVYLRQEIALEGKDEKQLQEELKAASSARKQLEEELVAFRSEREAISAEKKRVESGKGELAATKLALHFESEVNNHYGERAEMWFWVVLASFAVLLVFIFGVSGYYTFLGDWEQVSLQEGIAKILLFSALWYGLSFAIKNYNVNSHLVAVNRHRAAVARTLEDFLEAAPKRQAEMLKNATEAMFNNAPIGFITKAEGESKDPLLEIVNKFVDRRGG